MRNASILALFSLVSGAALLVRCGGDDSINIGNPDSGDTDTSVVSPDTGPPCTGKAVCAGQCVDTTSDPKNCGSCGMACNGKDACQGSKCISCDQVDQDMDGYNLCVDCDDTDPNVNPGAFDVPGSGKDWDCDGVDDTAVTCETSEGGMIASDTTDPTDFAHAMEMCDPWLTAAEFTVVASPKAHQVAPDWGLFKPRAGTVFAALSNGVAADMDDTKPAFVPNETPQLGTNFNTGPAAYPIAQGSTKCNLLSDGGATDLADPAQVNDLTQLKVTLKVPTNAHSFALDLNYLTTDSPEYNCTMYDDQVLVLLDSGAFKGNIVFDSTGRRMSINNDYLTLVTPGALTGTGMDQPAGNGQIMGGGTGWLTVKAPVVPKESITLRFIIFDVQDHIYDSQFLADHFRWSTDILGCGPQTMRVDGTSADGGAPTGCGEAGTD